MVGNGVDAQDLPGYAGHNDLGTAELLAAMSRTGVADLVLASSMVVYGDGRYTAPSTATCRLPHDERTTSPPDGSTRGARSAAMTRMGTSRGGRIGEDTPFRPRTSYAASKVAQEHYADAWCTLQDGRAIALRYHNVYGPGMPADTPYAGVAAIFRSALARGEAPRVFEDGGQVRDFVHVDDVALANVLSLERVHDHPSGVTAYNVASGQPFTIGEMAAVLARAGDGPEPVVTGEYRPFDVRHVVASPDAAVEGLGFRAASQPRGRTGPAGHRPAQDPLTAGRRTSKRQPSSRLRTPIEPCCASTRPWAIVRPMPAPVGSPSRSVSRADVPRNAGSNR